MAGRFFTVNTSLQSLGTSDVTVLQMRASATLPVRVLSIMATFVMVGTEVHPRIIITNQDGDGTSPTSITPQPTQPDMGVILATAFGTTFSSQPTSTEIVLPETILQPGAPFRFASPILVRQGKALGVRLWQPSTASGTYRIHMVCEE